jgi:transposase InsO family protein
VSTCDIPGCKACFLSKANCRRTPGRRTTLDPRIAGALKHDDIMPGDHISMDHYQSSVRGRMEYTSGFEREVEQYVGGTIFVDHASGLIMTHHQPTLASRDTLRLVGMMEQFFLDHNVPIRNFHTNNGVFTSSEFRKHLMDHDYKMSLSGVVAHHQNGVVE